MLLAVTLLVATVPFAVWWRLGNAPLDRDWTPYAYPALYRTPYLRGGHFDIKPPLIHWSFKCWMLFADFLAPRWPRFAAMSTPQRLRLLPALGQSLTVLATAVAFYNQGSSAGWLSVLLLGFLMAMPHLWWHMANTEWLGGCLLACAAASAPCPWLSWCFLGLMPLANVKNAVLLPLAAWSIHLQMTSAAWVAAPWAAAACWLFSTGRLRNTWWSIVSVPGAFAKARRFGMNTRVDLLTPSLWQAATFLPSLANSGWTVLCMTAALGSIATKQIVPHHLLVLVVPLVMAAAPTWAALLVLAAVWVSISWRIFKDPRALYPVTFHFGPGGHYGQMLASGAAVAEWIKKNTKPDEVIWVNGMENNIYLQAGRRAWWITVPEMKEPVHLVMPEALAQPDPPRVVVHCYGSGQAFDYSQYKPEYISADKQLTIMVKKEAQ